MSGERLFLVTSADPGLGASHFGHALFLHAYDAGAVVWRVELRAVAEAAAA